MLRVVLAAQEPDLARLLLTDDARQVRAAEAGVEAADARPGLAELRVVGGDRQIADEVQHVAAADRVARDLRDHRFRQVADAHVQVEHVEARHAVGADVAALAAHALIAAGAERVRPFAGEDHDADRRVVARVIERADHLGRRSAAGTRCGPRAGQMVIFAMPSQVS